MIVLIVDGFDARERKYPKGTRIDGVPGWTPNHVHSFLRKGWAVEQPDAQPASLVTAPVVVDQDAQSQGQVESGTPQASTGPQIQEQPVIQPVLPPTPKSKRGRSK